MLQTQFGRWTVVGDPVITDRGERKWLCRCACGEERFVLERSLKYGNSVSCGCLRKEKVAENRSQDLTGRVFGQLTVVQKAQPKENRRGVWWLCKCACGADYEVPGTLLITGRRTRCPGKFHEKNYAYVDISGQQFGRLTALYPTGEHDKSGSLMWHCICECGNEAEFSYNSLKYTNLKSCGCQKKEHNENLRSYLTHVAGTSMDLLKSKKLPVNNTTGSKGVYWIRGKYVAKIVFQKKPYYLGAYDSIEDAIQARKEAEKLLFEDVTEHYTHWKEKADSDPSWAQDNPVEIFVSQDQDKRLRVTLLPVMQNQRLVP